MGTPEQCREAAEAWAAVGADVVLGPASTTVWPPEGVRDSVTLFGEQVIPTLDDLSTPTRTDRFRQGALVG